jgi:predicted nucleotidyltransferase
VYNSLNYSPEEREHVQDIIDEVHECLKESLGDRITRFDVAGSFSKHTEVRGLSDVDIQLSIGDEYSEYTPLQVRRILKKVLRNKIKNAKIHNGDMALTLRYKGIDIQLIPVIPEKGGKVRVPKNDNNWSKPTDQKVFKKELDNLYSSYQRDPRDMVYRVQKVIKVMKEIENRRSPEMRLPGYYIENLVYYALRDGKCKRDATSGVLLKHCYEFASKQILLRTDEMSGQSRYVDSCLNSKQTQNRNKISQELSRTAS